MPSGYSVESAIAKDGPWAPRFYSNPGRVEKVVRDGGAQAWGGA